MTDTTKRKFLQLLKQPFSKAGNEFGNIGDVVNNIAAETHLLEGLADKAIAVSRSVEDFFNSLESLIKTYPNLSRNEFLKAMSITGLALAYLTQASCLGAPSAASIKKDRARLENMIWDANPIIPIPKEGCYTGFHKSSWVYSTEIDAILDWYLTFSKKLPTFWSTGRYSLTCQNMYFPRDGFEAMVNRGIIPLIRYGLEPVDFKGIVDGKFDDDLSSFSQQARDFKFPLLFSPFPEINSRAGHSLWKWGNFNHKDVKKAWIHMHNIFEDNGANHNTVWAIHYIDSSVGYMPSPMSWHYPGDDYVDWIGFTVCAADPVHTTGSSFDELFSGTYDKAKALCQNKPIAIFELSAENNSYYQPKWIKNTYKSFKDNYAALKLAQWWDTGMAGGLSPEGKKAYDQAISDKYFISTILPQKK